VADCARSAVLDRQVNPLRRRFFVSQFSGDTAVLAGAEAHHLARVLRAEPGQLYELSDGQRLCLARIEEVGRDRVEFAVVEELPCRMPKLSVRLLIAVVKFDRFEWALEKATELGAASITPLAAARSEKALLAAAPKRADRWRRILFESAQQARCLRPPVLEALTTPLAAFRAPVAGQRILLSEREGEIPIKAVMEAQGRNLGDSARPLPVTLGIGPEGGWTDEEWSQAQSAGFASASLGSNILRAETAVVAGLAAVHLFFD
jgi:16S rRNA (uracil1498-N3)-methyltransferase